ncbi:c-type cytochrome [Oceanimonas marisflavi]|uniref:c-type cytochrome n=1 Tax=Oceanimonas marisflavi TaxID=2059724 RepID=UPI000D2F5CAD|nr:cytochrome c [Oceanimonas marisflavi]
MNKLMTAAALVAMISAPAFAAGDAEAGKAKAAVCAACHGAEGISTMDIYPNLAGQKAAYVVAQLKAFKAGERNNPIMAPMAMPLSDQDMEDLAAYYASL